MTVTSPHPILCTIRARWLIAMLVLSFLAPSMFVGLIWPEWVKHPMPLPGAVSGLGTYVMLLAMLFLAPKVRPRRSLLGPIPSWHEAAVYALLGIPLIAISISTLYAFYIPLSYVSPDLVSGLLFDMPPLIWWPGEAGTSYAVMVANAINGFLLVLAAPVVEELLFRGFLLNRWHTKYGATKAVAFSSIAFGLLHVEIIGGIVFGVVLALIYLKTRSLVATMIVHAANNAIVLVVVIVTGLWYGGSATPTLMEFRSSWWLAPLAAVIGILWLAWFVKNLIDGKYGTTQLTAAAESR